MPTHNFVFRGKTGSDSAVQIATCHVQILDYLGPSERSCYNN